MSKFKYLLTFDVGIKNLAYCLIRHDITKSINDGFDILYWGILDVSFKPLICKHIKNKRKICNTVSQYYLLKDEYIHASTHSDVNNLIGYCKDHANTLKQTDKITHKKLFRVSKNDKFKDNFNIQMERLLVALEDFFNNKILSLYHTEQIVNTGQDDTGQYDTGQYDSEQTGTKINGYNDFSISNLEIYIENQPVFKNPIMKSISISIFTFFILKKIMLKSKIKSVNFISASDKTQLTFINSMKSIINIQSNIIDFKNYDKRKEFSIDITNQIIKKLNNSVFNIVSAINYNNCKKKDDLADTLIYAVYILLKNNNCINS